MTPSRHSRSRSGAYPKMLGLRFSALLLLLSHLLSGQASAMVLRIDSEASYVSHSAIVEILPADFMPDPDSTAGRLLAIRQRLEDEGMLTGLVDPLIRIPELMAEAGLSSDYYWDVMGLATSREPTFLRYIAGGVINLFGTLEIQPGPGEYHVDVDAS